MAQAVRGIRARHATHEHGQERGCLGLVLALVEIYQGGHNKTRKKYLQPLDSTGFTHTTIPFNVAEPIIGTAARAIDRLDALLGESEGTKVGVNFTGGTGSTGGGLRYPATAQQRQGSGGPACTICKRPGHVAKDCLVCMERELRRVQALVHARRDAQVRKRM